MKIGDRCFVHGYVDEIRKDTIIIRNNGGYFGTDPGEVIVVTDTAHPNWISCSDRLPEKDTRFYLTTIANHGLNFTTTLPDDVDVVRWDYDRRKGRNSWHWCTERTVIAWMPLPIPYTV